MSLLDIIYPVPDIREIYVNKIGEVWSNRSGVFRKLKLSKNHDGYFYIRIRHKKKQINYRVHRLMALTFIFNDDSTKNEVDHLNRIRTDNRIENLRWVNSHENKINIQPDGSIYKPKDNLKWKVSYPIYDQKTDKSKRLNKSFFTREEAEAQLAQWKVDYPRIV